MRNLILIVSLLIIWTGVAIAQERPELSVPQIVERVKKGVIRVETLNIGEQRASGGYGGGTGFVFEIDYDKGEAYAITNVHVAGLAYVCQVTFWDKASYRAELVAKELGIDVALLRITGIPDERDLPDSQKTIIPCVLGDSDQVQVGEAGIAMGNPGADEAMGTKRDDPISTLLLDQTVTANVVTGRETPLAWLVSTWNSARNEFGQQYNTNMNYVLRMSTPISPGNSGGPLFNSRGEVIGINYWGGSGTLFQNNNSAIPINLAKDFVFQILQTGKFEKPWIGLDIIMPLYIKTEEEYVEFVQRYRTKDMIVFNVRKDSPADHAGIKKGDIILEIDGQKFKTPEEVRLYIFSLEIGAKVSIVVKRNGEKKSPIEVEVSPKRKYNSEFSV